MRLKACAAALLVVAVLSPLWIMPFSTPVFSDVVVVMQQRDSAVKIPVRTIKDNGPARKVSESVVLKNLGVLFNSVSFSSWLTTDVWPKVFKTSYSLPAEDFKVIRTACGDTDGDADGTLLRLLLLYEIAVSRFEFGLTGRFQLQQVERVDPVLGAAEYVHEQDVWRFTWSDGCDLRIVEVEAQHGHVLHWLDTSSMPRDAATRPILSPEEVSIARSEAIVLALEAMEDEDWLGPVAGITAKLTRTGWAVELRRVEAGLPVVSDYIRVQVNAQSGRISAVTVRWSEAVEVKPSKMTAAEVAQLASEVVPGYEPWCASRTDCEMPFLALASTSYCPMTAYPVWVVRTEVGEMWYSASDGSIIRDERYLFAYEGRSIDVLWEKPKDVKTSPHYKAMDHVYRILERHFGSVTGQYLSNRTYDIKNDWLAASASYVFFSVGHGDRSTIPGGTENWIIAQWTINGPNGPDGDPCAYNSYVYADDVPNAPDRYLVYLLHCYSAWHVWFHEENCIAYRFMQLSRRTSEFYDPELGLVTVPRNAVIGFNDLVPQDEGTDFTKAFWDRLDAGLTVAQAFQSASAQYPSIGNMCVIFGDTSITIEG